MLNLQPPGFRYYWNRSEEQTDPEVQMSSVSDLTPDSFWLLCLHLAPAASTLKLCCSVATAFK